MPLKFTQLGTGSISPQAQGSVVEPRAPSRSPIHLQGHRHGSSYVSQRSSSVSKLSLPGDLCVAQGGAGPFP